MVVFAKVPEPGAVKTRLNPVLRARETADLAEALLLDTVEAGARSRMETVVAFTPARGRRVMERLLGPRVRLVAQGSGDLGTRLERVVDQLAAEKKRPIVVVGTDCPAVNAGRLRDAAAALERNDVVLGPALDGGFYLIGIRRVVVDLFRDVPWSTAGALEAVEARANEAHKSVHRLPVERDLDTPEDLYEWYAGARAAGLRGTYPRTWSALHSILPPRRLVELEEAIRL